MRLLLHRELHYDRLRSPLAEDPAAFLAPLRNSRVARAVWAPRGRSGRAVAAPEGRRHRLLIATAGNANFISDIRRRYEDSDVVETRYIDLAGKMPPVVASGGAPRIMEFALNRRLAGLSVLEDWLRPHIDWADTVFVEWCLAPAARITLLDPGETRIIVRMHSFEAFSEWPHLLDFSRVDDVVFVSEHLRDFAVGVLPQLRSVPGPRLSVIPNALNLRPFVRPKDAAARFTVGLVGMSSVAKDPRWALAALRRLRDRDPRYRLELIGGGIDPRVSASARRYNKLLAADLAELEPSGAVVRRGHVDDVPAALTGIGVILSASVRESFHCAVIEGAASGAVPVVRDWPFFPGGAATMFPGDWLVGSPEEAAERILAATSSEATWRKAGSEASATTLATWDWSTTAVLFDRLLFDSSARE
jgi:glycosyltransferase involved in cell wall biosynthesis